MKTTIDLPDDLYRQVKSKSALQGKRIREVAIDLFQHWLAVDEAGELRREGPEIRWLDQWFAMADELMTDAPPGPSARSQLAADRDRLGHGA